MSRTVAIDVAVSSEASGSGLSTVGRQARDMADDVKAASREASSGLSGIGDAADDLDSKAGKATGALGALSSGFELVGMEKYAGGLQAVAMATDFASGAGQAMTLLLELESVKRVRAIATATAHTVATKAQAAATKAGAVAQWAINAAMAANPVGIIILAVVALIAGFVLLFRRNEEFRTKIMAVMKAARGAVDPVLDVIQTVAQWIGEKVPAGFELFRKGAVKALDLVLAPVNLIKDAIRWIIDKLATIKLPSLPDWLGGGGGDAPTVSDPGRGLAPSLPGRLPGRAGMTAVDQSVHLTVQVDGSGMVDEHKVADQLERVLTRHAARLGRPPALVPA